MRWTVILSRPPDYAQVFDFALVINSQTNFLHKHEDTRRIPVSIVAVRARAPPRGGGTRRNENPDQGIARPFRIPEAIAAALRDPADARGNTSGSAAASDVPKKSPVRNAPGRVSARIMALYAESRRCRSSCSACSLRKEP